MKYVLLTGAAGGMGQKAAITLAQSGYFVFALDKKPILPSVNIMPITADLTDAESVKNAFEIISAHTDELYGIMHFAGIYMLDSLLEIESESFERIFKINLGGVFLINKTFAPLLKKGSRVLIITSELAPLDPLPFTGIYAITKAAVDKYAYSLRMELQLLDVYVSVLRAGATDTDMLPASTSALDRFCANTQLYSCNAERFKRIVDSVEARNISAQRLADKALRIFEKKRPRFAYSINRNPLLLLLNALPKRLQLWIIKKLLK